MAGRPPPTTGHFYFGPEGVGRPRYRLVYRYTPNEIEAVAVGRRANLDAYLRAIHNSAATPETDGETR